MLRPVDMPVSEWWKKRLAVAREVAEHVLDTAIYLLGFWLIERGAILLRGPDSPEVKELRRIEGYVYFLIIIKLGVQLLWLSIKGFLYQESKRFAKFIDTP